MQSSSPSPSSTLNIGIIGTGWPGQQHTKAVLAGAKTHLYAAADLNPERRDEFKAEHKPDKMYAEYTELLADPNVDAVIISLPNFLHFPATMAALEAGKHVLCEKPPTMNLAEMAAVKAHADLHGLVYSFGRQMRFNAKMRAARELVQAGRLGDIYYSRASWVRARGTPIGVGGWFIDKEKSGGGVVIDLGIHALDSAWYLMGAPRPLSVSANVFLNFGHLIPAGVKCDVEDAGFAYIRFANGSVMHLEVSWAGNLPDEHPVTWSGRESQNAYIYGKKAALRVNPLTLFEDQDGKVVDLPQELTGDTESNGFNEQMEDFASAIIEGREPVNSSQQAYYLMEMLDAIYVSSEQNREITFKE